MCIEQEASGIYNISYKHREQGLIKLRFYYRIPVLTDIYLPFINGLSYRGPLIIVVNSVNWMGDELLLCCGFQSINYTND